MTALWRQPTLRTCAQLLVGSLEAKPCGHCQCHWWILVLCHQRFALASAQMTVRSSWWGPGGKGENDVAVSKNKTKMLNEYIELNKIVLELCIWQWHVSLFSKVKISKFSLFQIEFENPNVLLRGKIEIPTIKTTWSFDFKIYIKKYSFKHRHIDRVNW